MADNEDDDIDLTAVNDQLVLIGGESGTGKSLSLFEMRDQEESLYLNCEAGKRLPFKNKFHTEKVTDPLQVYEAFDYAVANGYKSVIIDTLTFLMDMYESQYIVGSSDTMKGWANYNQYFKNLMQKYVAPSGLQVVILAHTVRELDEKSGKWFTRVPVKGALKNQGIEAYFSTVVATKKIELKDLPKGYDEKLLHITPQDQARGFKHVFQTQITKETVGERIRGPLGMFEMNQLYMDNNAQLLLDHLREYYA